MAARKLSPEEIAQLPALYHSGLTCRAIVERLGVAEATVGNRLRSLGVRMRPRHVRVTPPKMIPMDLVMVEERRNGKSIFDIAEAHGVSMTMVRFRIYRGLSRLPQQAQGAI